MPAKTHHQRKTDFEKMCKSYSKNSVDLQIPGYKPNEKSTSYLLEIKALEGLKLPKDIRPRAGMKLGVQFHLSFFYSSKN